MKSPRIVSLIPSATEIVSGLGMQEHLVGRSHECDFPTSVTDRPILSKPRIDVDADSRQIDAQVKEIVRDALSVYEVDAGRLAELQPDVVLTQSQCEVCAVSLSDVRQALADWIGQPPEIVTLEPMQLVDVWADIQRVADALGVSQRGEELIGELKGRLAVIRQRAEQIRVRPRIACIEWIDPLMAAGNWVPELVQIAGGENVLGEAGQHSAYLEWEALTAADPDVIVALPCGFGIERTESATRTLSAQSGFMQLRAVASGRLFVTDGHHYFNRPGPRLVESAEILAEILHPDEFAFGHHPAGWRRLERFL